MSRRSVLLLVVVIGGAFLAISFLLARVISAANAEREAAIELVKDQAGGNLAAVLGRIEGCGLRPPCRVPATRLVARLRHPGHVSILNVKAPGFSIGGRTAVTRIAWRAGNGPPVVQCVRARRTGDPFGGYRVTVLSLSAPIGSESAC